MPDIIAGGCGHHGSGHVGYAITKGGGCHHQQQRQQCPSPRSVFSVARREAMTTSKSASRSPSPPHSTPAIAHRIPHIPTRSARMTIMPSSSPRSNRNHLTTKGGETSMPPPSRPSRDPPSPPPPASRRIMTSNIVGPPFEYDQDDDEPSSLGCDHRIHDVVEGGGATIPPPTVVDYGRRRIVIGNPPAGATKTTTTSDDARIRLAGDHRIAGMVGGDDENENEDGKLRPRLDDVTDLVVYDCRMHSRAVVLLLGRMPNLESLTLFDFGGDEYDVRGIEELEWILARLGTLANNLSRLVIEFEHRLVNGTRLSFLRCVQKLEHLRLRGFDLSDGLSYVSCLMSLRSLHLCHGNSNAIPNNDVDENELLSLMGMASNLSRVHLEGFENLSHLGLRPFLDVSSSINYLVLRHCRGLNGDGLGSFGSSKHLTSLHIVHGPCDDDTTFGPEGLRYLNSLSRLRRLSLIHVLRDASDLWALRGLTSLECLNVAFVNDARMVDPSEDDDWRELCRSRIVPAFPSLRRLRIFAEGCIVAARTCRYGRLDVEFASHDHEDSTFLD